MTLISIPTIKVDGIPVQADSGKLSEPTGLFGVRQIDTAEIIVPDGTDMEYADGVYSYEFDGLPDKMYEVWFELGFEEDLYWTNIQVSGTGEVVPTNNISFCAVKNGEFVDFAAEPPRFESPAGQFGVKSMLDGTVVLQSGAVLGSAGGTLYTRAIEIVPGSRYRFYIKAIVDGVVYYVPGTTASVWSAMLAVGRYTDTLRVGRRFGVDNLHLWLSAPQGDLDEPVDYAQRAYDFIHEAEAELDDQLQGAFVKGPFIVDADNLLIPSLIIRLATDLVGVKMYEARGVDDINPETNEPFHRLRYVKNDVRTLIKRIKMGLMPISGSASLAPSLTPFYGSTEITPAS